MRDIIAILLVCLAVYANSLDNGFHYDDEHSIQKNIHIRDLGNITRFFHDPTTFSVDHDKAMYRPVLLVTYALNYAAGGYEVFGYHLLNLALHALSACLLFWLALLVTGRRDLALSAGLLFALHPICSEPVNYISSRSEGLAGFFYLAGLALFIRSTQSDHQARWRYLSWGALATGLLSKSIVITLPTVILVWDYLFISSRQLQRLRDRFVQWHLAYWLLAGLYVATIVHNRFLTKSLAKPVRGMGTQFLTQVEALVYYGKLLIWPLGLNVEHQFFAQAKLGAPSFAAGLLLAVFFLVLIGAYRRRWDLPLFLNLWALLALLPVTLMPLNVLVNERRLYLPCAAFCLGLAMTLHSRRMQRMVGGVAQGRVMVLLIVMGYGALTFSRNELWQSDFALWTDAVSQGPKMPRNHLYLGNTHKDAAFASVNKKEELAHWELARESYRRTIELDHKSDLALRALNNLGAVSFVLKDIDSAEKAYRRAIKLNPNYADALVNLGTIYHEKARVETDPAKSKALFAEAADSYRKALRSLPNHADAWANMGLALFEIGELGKAIKAYERAYYLNPGNVNLVNNFGNYYVTLGQQQIHRGESGRENLLKAKKYFEQALRMNPNYGPPKRGLQIVEQFLR